MKPEAIPQLVGGLQNPLSMIRKNILIFSPKLVEALLIIAVSFSALPILEAKTPPANLRCEWRVNPTAVPDPYPEFFWEAPGQGAFRVLVAESREQLASGEKCLWDSGKVESPLSIVEYGGPPLQNGVAYFWRVQVWNDSGASLPDAAIQTFQLDVKPLPHHLPTIRTFMNFGGNPDFARDWLDLSYRKDVKQARKGILTMRYGLICTMVLPHPTTGKPLSGKAKALADFCAAKGLGGQGIPEEMFCHFAVDTKITLHEGAERAASPMVTRICPGWDPANDRNGDGRVDDDEFAQLANPGATAREPRQARLPIYFLGPPMDDFVMNVGHPAYQEFMATVWAPELCEEYDGIYFDTVPPHVAGPGGTSQVREFPGSDPGKWLRDLQTMFAQIKIALPDKFILGNGWNADPMTNDGRQKEAWQSLRLEAGEWRTNLDRAVELDRRGKMQLIQYNPIFHPELAEFGRKLPVSHERDRLYGLATYLLAHGRFTYFGFGMHPYLNASKSWFEAMRYDLGQPQGPYELFAERDRTLEPGPEKLLVNGGFEEGDSANKPAGWQTLEPIELDREVKRSGASSTRITSESRQTNNINRQYLRLKPRTDYTLVAWAKTDGLEGNPGVQVYPYEFDGVEVGRLTWKGTEDWSEQRLVFRTKDDVEGRINFRVYQATGTAWLDDLQLIEGIAIKEQIFVRKYSKGLVLVKPYVGGSFGDETASRHKLPGEFQPLHADGSLGDPVDEVTLRNGEAAILVQKVGPP